MSSSNRLATHDILFLGLGYSARAIAARLGPRGWSITGTSTSTEGVARIAATGAAAILFDGNRPSRDLAARLQTSTHLIISVAPDANGDPTLRHHADAIGAAPHLRWIGYLSTVGVYGDRQGEWVDETSQLRPAAQRSRQRAAAEAEWLALASDARPVRIFRLSGIYGPGRSAIDNLRRGTARRIDKPGQVFNRIHVEDIATAVVASIDQVGQHSVYNVTDDEPAPPQDVVAYAASLLGLPVPPLIPFEAAELSAMGRGFYGENKRVSNRRIKQDLGMRFAFPTYREGMQVLAKG